MANSVFKAIEFATKVHNGQFRKGTQIPFIVHPIGVGRKLIEIGASEALIIAGFLHDSVEDTSATLDEIRVLFGKKVAGIIDAASEPDKAKSWKERKQHTIDKLKTASMDVLIVECADKLDNIKDIRNDYKAEGDKLWSRLTASKEDQKWYYTTLTKIFSKRAKGKILTSLSREFKAEVRNAFGKR